MTRLATTQDQGQSGNRYILAFLAVSVPVFYLFTYNSGLGYDQLEYLIIGRGLVEGIPLYAYYPSKSFGIFVLVAALYSIGIDFGHASLSAVITAVYLAMTATTYWVVQKTSGWRTALISTLLVAVCIFFMELNFLQPTGFVYLAGIVAFFFIIQGVKESNAGATASLFAAGVIISVGAHFKSVALFYLAGAGLFLLVRSWQECRSVATGIVKWGGSLSAGFLVGFGLPMLYFLSQGTFQEFWKWTVTYPLFVYPATTTYVDKLYTKLLFIHVLIIAALVLSLIPRVRKEVYSDPAAVLALCMGIASYVAVFKSQASHYFFPGATFLSIFAAITFCRATTVHGVKLFGGRYMWAIGALACVATATSVFLYRPEAFLRLVTIQNYEPEERRLISFIQRMVPEGKRMLIFRSDTKLYWLSHRYPPGRLISTDEKTAWFFRHDPEMVLDRLDAPDLVLVEFNLDKPDMIDASFLKRPGDRELLERFQRRLEQRFVHLADGPEGYVFWVRKQ